MSQQVVSPNGIHVTGDFQDEAGYPSDWDPATTPMMQEPADTNIYSVVLDLPAFTKYEFKFVNGIFGYEQEFVPVPSRVNFNFIDSRWIYVDSLANDTLDIGAILFAGNAPAGKHLLRFYVDMQNEASVNASGVHVSGAFQGWNPAATQLYSFDGNVYEYIAYVDTGLTSFVQEYRFLNGNMSGDYETVPASCVATGSNRGVTVVSDTMLATVCYSACVSCASVGLAEYVAPSSFEMWPNPADDHFVLAFSTAGAHDVQISDMAGRTVRELFCSESTLRIETAAFVPGIYFVSVRNPENGSVAVKKLVTR
jgi:alpha-amylase